jgi:hypothetical protein
MWGGAVRRWPLAERLAPAAVLVCCRDAADPVAELQALLEQASGSAASCYWSRRASAWLHSALAQQLLQRGDTVQALAHANQGWKLLHHMHDTMAPAPAAAEGQAAAEGGALKTAAAGVSGVRVPPRVALVPRQQWHAVRRRNRVAERCASAMSWWHAT